MKFIDNKVTALTTKGWTDVQMDGVIKLQKSWTWENEEYRVDAFFGKLRTGTPAVVQNVYRQGAGTKQVIDDNCDVWENIFAITAKEEGNWYFKYLLKHGFSRA